MSVTIVPSSATEQIPSHIHAVMEIDLAAVQANYRYIQQRVKPAVCFPVIKADAYGLGLTRVSQALMQVGATHFFTADLTEALTLREACPQANIAVLCGVLEHTESLFLQHRFTPVLIDLAQIKRWQAYALRQNRALPALLHVDTGISRTGLSKQEIMALIQASDDLLTGIHLQYVMTHLACADEPDHPMNSQQLQRFLQIKQHFPYVPASISGTEGIYLGQVYHLDMVRPGKALYGLDLTIDPALQNVLQVKARVLQVRSLDSGDSIGYGASFTCSRSSRIATLGIGYADGWLRALSNKGWVMIANHRAPIVGRISMDLITVDVTDIPEHLVYPGCWASLIHAQCPAAHVAQLAGTISREITCHLHPRCYRVYTYTSETTG